jgi:hypothetical protein
VPAGAVAMMLSGAIPFSIQFTNAVNGEKESVEGPPLQCPMPGTRNRRMKSFAWPIRRSMALYQIHGVIPVDRIERGEYAVRQAMIDDHLPPFCRNAVRLGDRAIMNCIEDSV